MMDGVDRAFRLALVLAAIAGVVVVLVAFIFGVAVGQAL